MKKVFLLTAALITGITLSSFIINETTASKTVRTTDKLKFITKVTAYQISDGEEKNVTLYIFYDEDFKGYCCNTAPDGGYYPSEVLKNRLYKKCNDRRSNYRYTAAGNFWYFNANLPNSDIIRSN